MDLKAAEQIAATERLENREPPAAAPAELAVNPLARPERELDRVRERDVESPAAWRSAA
jgi:hypothetical protein